MEIWNPEPRREPRRLSHQARQVLLVIALGVAVLAGLCIPSLP
jgi:hypothetical protein